MLAGCAISVFAMMLLAWAREVAGWMGGGNGVAIALAVWAIYLIDFVSPPSWRWTSADRCAVHQCGSSDGSGPRGGYPAAVAARKRKRLGGTDVWHGITCGVLRVSDRGLFMTEANPSQGEH